MKYRSHHRRAAAVVMAGRSAVVLVAVCLALDLRFVTAKQEVYYLSMERFNVTYCNPRYLIIHNAGTRRYGRRDPKYYLNASFRTLMPADNNVTMDIFFYEYRSNEYRRGFVEMHFRWCDLVQKDFFFGPALRASGLTCPLPKGEHHMVNGTVPELPLLRTFPFRKGRIYGATTYREEIVLKYYVDIEIKQITRP